MENAPACPVPTTPKSSTCPVPTAAHSLDALLGSDAKADSEEDMKRLVANLRQSVHSQEEKGG